MYAPKETPSIRDDLSSIQAELIPIISILVGTVGYVCLTWLLWYSTNEIVPVRAWIGSLILILVPFLSYKLINKLPKAASYLLIGGISICITLFILEYSLHTLVYFFIIPIIITSFLLSPGDVIITSLCCVILIGAISKGKMGLPLNSVNVIIPVATLSSITIVYWLCLSKTKDELDYISSALERAQSNEQIAREHRAELARALKSLDNAYYQLNRANYMLSLLRKKAMEGYRLKQQFAQNISHELRTPLNLIISFIDLMTQSPEIYSNHHTSSYIRDLSVIYRNACHLRALVNDVLDLAQIEAAQMIIVPEEIMPATLVDEAVTTMRNLVESKGLQLNTKTEPNLPCIWVDPTRIRQVLYNLINNAIRFTDCGSITVSVHSENDIVTFSVADTGIGIEEKDVYRIFDEFQCVHDPTGRRRNGAGLGLSISRRFVELHGGRIWVESQPGRGSTFYFSLPTSHSRLIDLPDLSSTKFSHSEMYNWGDDSVLLVITANPAAGTFLKRNLPSWHTVVVNELQQAHQVAANFLPQVVIIDSALDQMNSLKLLEIVGSMELPYTLFIMCSLPRSEPDLQSLSVDGYLFRPISIREVMDVLLQFNEGVEKILVISDHRDFILLLARMLETNLARRYQLISASNGLEGLEIMSSERPDLIMVDLGLPNKEGLSIIEGIRSSSMWKNIPIVIITEQEEYEFPSSKNGPMFITRTNGLPPGEMMLFLNTVLKKQHESLTAPIGKEGAEK